MSSVVECEDAQMIKRKLNWNCPESFWDGKTIFGIALLIFGTILVMV